MADVFVVVGVLVFFGLCILYVAGLDRLIGPDADAGATSPGGDESRDAVTAGAEGVR
jgi:hypothetical protein